MARWLGLPQLPRHRPDRMEAGYHDVEAQARHGSNASSSALGSVSVVVPSRQRQRGVTDAPEKPAPERAASYVIGNQLELVDGEAEMPLPEIVLVVPPPEDMQVLDSGGERLCIICLGETVAIMLLPCRHAVLCRGCAAELRGGYQGRCPICRSQVTGVVVGRFQEDFVRLLTSYEQRIDSVQASLYEGMYNHVRLLMVVGVFLLLAAVAVLVVLGPAFAAACAMFAGASFLIGYLPWFLTTVAAFEQQDGGSGRGRTWLCHLASPNPLACCLKTVVLVIGCPIATVVFFLPYFCFCLLRPVARIISRGLLLALCYGSAYVVSPAVRAIGCLCCAAAEAVRWFRRGICYMLVAVAQLIWKTLVVPCCQCLWAAVGCVWTYGVRPVLSCLETVCTAMRTASVTAAKLASKHVLQPSRRGLGAVSAFLGYLAKALFKKMIAPLCYAIAHVITFVCNALHLCLSSICNALYLRLSAICHALYRCLSALHFGLSAICSAVCWVLGKICSALLSCCLTVCEVLGHAIWTCIASCLGAIAYVLAAAAVALFVYMLSPLGSALAAAWRGVSWALLAVAATVYMYLLTPIGLALRLIANSVIVPCLQTVFSVGAAVLHFVAGAARTVCTLIHEVVQNVSEAVRSIFAAV